MARNKNILIAGFEDVKTLCRYLYADPENSITVENALSVPVRINMHDDLRLRYVNTQFPTKPIPGNFSLNDLLNMVDQLKDQPPVELTEENGCSAPQIKTRWDEIKILTASYLSMNKTYE